MFYTSSAYKLITNHFDNSCHPFPHKWIWKTTTINKIKHFLWLFVLNHLPTASLLYHRKITLSATCSICPNNYENQAHLFIHCQSARNVWTYFNIQPPITDRINWLQNYCRYNVPILINHSTSIPLKIPTRVILWHIWLNLNRYTFDRCTTTNVCLPSIISHATQICFLTKPPTISQR